MRSRLIINCDNKKIRTQLVQAGETIGRLNAMAFTVNCVELDGYQRPVIRVNYDHRCRQAQEQGAAVRLKKGNDPRGDYEQWEFQMNNCRVIWEAR